MNTKRIVILGAGESGAGAAVLAKKQGFEVFVSDSSAIAEEYRLMLDNHDIEYEQEGHTMSKILDASEIIKSPGIPDKAPVIQSVISQGIHIISEIEFAGRYTDAKMICITGSNGKTTTTSLTYHIFRNAGLDVGLAGNIGRSLALQVAQSPHQYYVIELSSFQLDNMYDFRADVAILLNITPDHLDRYHYDFQEYADAKFRIIRNQTSSEAFIYWAEDPVIRAGIERHKPQATMYPFGMQSSSNSSYATDTKLFIATKNSKYTMERELLSIKGQHNLYNSMAAGIAAKVMDIRDERIRASLSDFAGVEHRLEPVARVRGVDYINDSKATNVNSCWYALQSVNTPIVLILGGTDKGNDYTEIEELVCRKARALIFLGVDNSKLHAFFDTKVPVIADAHSMQEAVNKAYGLAVKGDTVLLSPCCASFDLFRNYEDRGEQFKASVLRL
ncbi:MAG: UDP-N-acetylmuramoyl-L-alanine--D-glutamate ligase [Tannerella sp.]|jgi:UDP-N-acetylmuramoylalanine--D-glutamate ligase|nr:UDP-N-acetylmuramoyl-L-alanine--D-glutamate ligase [Tannerella sp.]